MIGLALVSTIAVMAGSMKASIDDVVDDEFAPDFIAQSIVFAPFSTVVGDQMAQVPGVDKVSRQQMLETKIGKDNETISAADADFDDVNELKAKSGSVDFGAGKAVVNENKAGLFTLDERLEMLGTATDHLPNVTLASFRGLLVDFCTANDIAAVVKGLRAVSDFDYELQMAQMNGRLSGVDTLFIPTSPEYSYLASSLVKEVAKGGGDVSGLVPDEVVGRLTERFAR